MRTTQPTPVAPALLGNVVRSLSFAETPAPPPNPPPPKPAPIAIASTIRVVVRIRPLTEKESQKAPDSCLIPSDDPRTLHIRLGNPRAHRPNRRAAGRATFKFSTIFHQHANQAQLFDSTTLPLIDRLFQGSSSVVFAYGVTGSGKTWTIAGDRNHPGILPRALDVIVNSIAVSKGHGLRQDSAVSDGVALLTEGLCAKRRRGNKIDDKVHDDNYITVDGSVDYTIFASYIEIYNEQVYDLFESIPDVKDEPRELDPEQSDASSAEHSTKDDARRNHHRKILKLREDSSGEVYADGQTECEIKSGADIERLLEFGHRNRSVAHTIANEHSSRSHAIFIITLKQCRTVPQTCGPPKVFRTSAKLHIVDLAGTERSSACGDNLRSKETSQINLSLMNLSRCFEALRKNQRMQRKDPSKPLGNVPFRNSRLTRLLQRSLTSGSAVMIANVSPFAHSADETIKALQNGASAQEVRISPNSTTKVLCDITNNTQRALGKKKPPGPLSRMTRSQATQRAMPKENRTQSNLDRKNQLLATSNEQMKLKLHEAQSDILQKEKEIARLQDANEELQMDLEARDRELDQMFLEKERLAEQVAVDQARFRWMEAEIREEVYKEAEQLIKEIQDQYEQQLKETLDKKQDLRRRELQMSERKRREYVEKVARRFSRASIAAVDQVIPNDDDEEEMEEDDEEQWSSDGGEEELGSEEDNYEEEEEDEE